MPNLEKVVQGLECCEHPYAKKCAACPYDFYTPDSMECTGYLCKDVLALLKEQEPVVATWYKVDDGVFGLKDGYKCGECSAEIERSMRYCPYCGRKVKWND